MQLIPRKPEQPMSLRSAFDQLMSDAFWDPFHMFDTDHLPSYAGRFLPSINLSETDTEVEVAADVPGYDQKNISVNLEDHILTLQGEMKDEQEEKDKKYYCRQCSSGSFFQRIALPHGIDASKAKCSMKNGKLRITIPKTEDKHMKKLTIEVEE
ncbi:MAG: Hsp20/alpha crystallin family protein [Candidatus Peribacteraceae bacterium]|nr:Hsp20/alpha crystallin family protein [Candidatus Peribacteraceae bacterium]